MTSFLAFTNIQKGQINFCRLSLSGYVIFYLYGKHY